VLKTVSHTDLGESETSSKQHTILSAVQMKRTISNLDSDELVFMVMVKDKVDEMRSSGADPEVCQSVTDFSYIFPEELPGLAPMRDTPRTIILEPVTQATFVANATAQSP